MTFELIEGGAQTQTHVPLMFTSLREKNLDALVERVGEKDKADLRVFLSDCMNQFTTQSKIVIPIAMRVATASETCETWREFLTIANLGRFLMNDHVRHMFVCTDRIREANLFHSVDLEAEFYAFMATCFMIEYAPQKLRFDHVISVRQ